jgi:hypothetical protein
VRPLSATGLPFRNVKPAGCLVGTARPTEQRYINREGAGKGLRRAPRGGSRPRLLKPLPTLLQKATHEIATDPVTV